VWRNGTLEAEGFPFEKISDYLEQDDCLVWSDLCAPQSDLLAALAEELSLDPLAVEDAVTQRERPKASRYKTHTFLAAYAVSLDDGGRLAATQVSAFVVPRGVFTVRQREDFDITQVVQRWDDNADLVKYGPKALVYGLLDVVVDGHFAAIESLDDQIEQIEDILFEETRATSREVQRRSYSLRKSLVEGAVSSCRCGSSSTRSCAARASCRTRPRCNRTSRTCTTTCCAPQSGRSHSAT
jgi:magnesium transporter